MAGTVVIESWGGEGPQPWDGHGIFGYPKVRGENKKRYLGGFLWFFLTFVLLCLDVFLWGIWMMNANWGWCLMFDVLFCPICIDLEHLVIFSFGKEPGWVIIVDPFTIYNLSILIFVYLYCTINFGQRFCVPTGTGIQQAIVIFANRLAAFGTLQLQDAQQIQL